MLLLYSICILKCDQECKCPDDSCPNVCNRKEYSESCFTNKRFSYRNQKFRNYGIRIIKQTGPTAVEPSPCDHITEEEKIRRSETCKSKMMPTFLDSGNHAIDATLSGNQAKFVNHSCDPNSAEEWKLHGMAKFRNSLDSSSISLMSQCL
ncbi:Protein CBG15433 [Caenorhabditis briggsae]|uniref:Protein CBG15433 n=1 Tax=Caenorhabditis briggsae TaxID=6238 RepID=A8XMA7_CAEBR|nr:Protein CBG15433 [Caenorhabditis briggsae]CAP33782.1 Protein CBG15433 [Caenorhabditis briggsae]